MLMHTSGLNNHSQLHLDQYSKLHNIMNHHTLIQNLWYASFWTGVIIHNHHRELFYILGRILHLEPYPMTDGLILLLQRLIDYSVPSLVLFHNVGLRRYFPIESYLLLLLHNKKSYQLVLNL